MGNHHPGRLAQHLVRILAVLEHVVQQHDVDAVGLDRQLLGFGKRADALPPGSCASENLWRIMLLSNRLTSVLILICIR